MTVPNDSNTYLPPVIAIPSALEITNITRSNPMVISVVSNTDQANTYIPGQLIKLNVPVNYKMIQANGLTVRIVRVLVNDISVNVDSTNFDAFVVPMTGEQPASIAPSGSQNLQFSNLTNQIGFQSQNNIGN